MSREQRRRVDRGGGDLPIHEVAPNVGGKLRLAAAVLPAQKAIVRAVLRLDDNVLRDGLCFAGTVAVKSLRRKMEELWCFQGP